MSNYLTVNLHRGLLSLGRLIAARLPLGSDVWDAGLEDVAKRALQRSEIPAGELPVADLVDKLAGVKAKRARCHT